MMDFCLKQRTDFNKVGHERKGNSEKEKSIGLYLSFIPVIIGHFLSPIDFFGAIKFIQLSEGQKVKCVEDFIGL
jgi:hypothetical protein